MKKSIIIIAVILMASFTTKVMAQMTANNDAKGEIISQLGITATSVMDFGKMAVLAGQDGTCVLSTSAGRTRTGGVNLSLSTPTNAEYDVTGENSATYAITLPASITVTRVSGTETMIINDLKLKTATNVTERTAVSAVSALDGSGNDHIVVGGTLNVTQGQAKGNYKATYALTVAYN